ncbi:MAG: sigma-54 dependent transcriptional regulator [Myxococcota bacterium]
MIWVVDDDPDVLFAAKLELARHFPSVETFQSPEGLLDRYRAEPPDVVLLDMNFSSHERSGREGLSVLEKLLAEDADAAVVLITAYAEVGAAVEAMKRGAVDFVEKPWDNQRLVATVQAASRLRRSRREASQLRTRHSALAEASSALDLSVVHRSPAMVEVLRLAERAGPTDANVLLLGENGTGKEVLARYLHHCSGRSPLVSVDLGAVQDALFESELFGHVEGAFTDAKKARAGRFQAAEGGTLFLDEVGNLPLHLQSKLLTALERRTVTPVGSDEPVSVNVRVLAATNLSAEELADPGRFRQDLLFRLNTVEIHLPPLRQRPEDIRPLVAHFLEEICRRYGKAPKTLSEQTYRALETHPWPGNVRALRHSVERAVILSAGPEVVPEDFALPPTALAAAARALPSTTSASLDGELNLERLERAAVQAALTKHGYNISHAAKELGITRAALYRRMEKHGL